MKDKTRDQLVAENEELRGRLAALEGVEAERSRAAEELRRSEAKWRSLVGNIPLFTAVIDRSGKIEFHNDCYQPGYTPENVIGRVIYDFIQPEYHAIAGGCLERVFSTGKPTFYESVGSGPNGALSSYEVHISPIVVDGEVVVAALISRDITARKRAEEALRQSEQRLSLHFQQTPLAAIEWETEGRVTKWNPSAERIFGYSKEEALGHHVSFIVPPHVREHVDQVSDDLRVRKGGERSTNENITKDGRTILCEWYNTPLIDAEGHVVGAVSLAQDITEQKRSETKLQDSERTLRTLIDASPESILLADPTATILLVNKTAADRLGRPIEHIVGRKPHDVVPPEVADRRMRYFEEVVRTGKPVRFDDVRSGRHIDNVMQPILDDQGKVTGVALLGIDQTDRKRAEEALRESEARSRLLADVIELSSQPFGMGYPDGKLGIVNTAYCDLVGYSEDERRTLDWSRDLTPPEWHAIEARHLEQLLRTRTPVRYEKEYIRKDGSRIPVELFVHLVCDKAGSPQYYYSFLTDLTERKQAEAALQKAHDELEQKVKERTAELLAANEQLRIFRMFTEASGQGFGMADLDGRITYWNPMLCRLFGEDKPENVVGKPVSAYYPKEYWEKRQNEILPVVIRDGHWQGELLVYSRQGKATPILQNTFLIRDDKGNPLRLAAAITDITERKQAEDALRESEKRVRAICDSAFDAVVMIDASGKVLYWNLASERMFGYTIQEMLGCEVHAILTPVCYREQAIKAFSEFKTTGQGRTVGNVLELTALRRDGTEFPIEISVAAFQMSNQWCAAAIISDITERKAAEAALQQSHNELQTIYNGMPDGLVVADIETKRFVRCNASMRRMLGYSESELLVRSVMDIHPVDEMPSVLKEFHALVDGGQRVAQDIPVLRNDGSVFHVDVTHSEFTLNGRRCSAGFFRDITERKRAEEALRQSHDELQTIYSGMFTGLLVIDLETKRFVRTNPSICRMLGYSEAELLTMSVMDIHPADEIAVALDRIQARVEGRLQGYVDTRLLRKDGLTLNVVAVSSRLTCDGRHCIAAFFLDITKRKQAEAALAESEAKHRQLIETTDTGYLILDDEGRVVDANQEYVRISGHHDLSEIVGHSVVEWTAPYDRDRNAREVGQCVQAGQVQQLEIDYVGSDGTVIPIEIHASVITTKEGKRILSLCRDITERRQSQAALERERRTLEHMLRASDHERQLIAYDIHDGLAQELAGAIMQFQVYSEFKESKPGEAKMAYDGGITLLRRSHAEARRLISGVRPPILDESGVMAAISHLVHDPAFDQGPKIDFRSRVTFSRLNPVVENVIYRIVQEGLSNARNHSKSKKIVVSLVQRGERLRIEVRDWGVGFDPKTVQENRFGVDGIRERARLLGGKCNIKSKPSEGTTVVVELPVTEHRQEE